MTQISTMTPLGSLPSSGAIVPLAKTGDKTPYNFDLAAYATAINTSLAAKASLSALAASDGVSLVGGAAKSDFSNITGANRLLTDDNLFSPVGNGANTRGKFNLLAQTSHNDIREMMFCLGANFTNGTSGSGSPSEKVTLYVGANMQTGSFKGWAFNPLMHIEAGVPVEYVNTVEVDIDNYSGGDFGSAIGAAGLTGAVVWGMTINGANPGSNTVTGAIALISSASGPIYERGFVVGPNSTKQAAFDDYSSATASFRDSGSHSYGIDLSKGTYSQAAIRVPDTFRIVSRNAGNNGDINLIEADGTNQTIIGDTAGGNIVLSNQVLPDANATRQIGSPTLKYAAIHTQRVILYPLSSVTPSANGEMQFELTNDTTLKIKVKGSDGTVRSGTITLS